MGKFLISTSPLGKSGSDYLFGLGHTLNDLGHEVIIITDQNKPELLPPGKQNLHYYSWPSKRPTKIRDFKFLKEICKKYKPDCAIGTFGSTNIILVGGFWGGGKTQIGIYSNYAKAARIRL